MNANQGNPFGGGPPPLAEQEAPHPSLQAVAIPDPIPISANVIAQAINKEADKKENVAPQPNILPSSSEPVLLQQSYYLSSNDRYDLEQYIMRPLSVTDEDPNCKKADILRLQSNKTLTNNETLNRLRQDGVYCDRDPTLHQKFTDQNVVKLEQRLLREKQYLDTKYGTDKIREVNNGEYFKLNGEIKLQNDLLADEITRPADLAFEQSEAYQTREINSVLSDRMHSFKQRYYRLDINVGKIILYGYPDYFSPEDVLSIELKELFKEWERRTSLALIPFYMERLKFMEDEQYKREREGMNPLKSKEDDEFLKRNIEETTRKLEQEKREIQEVADQLYRKWKEIKVIRKENNYSSTNIMVKVHKNPNGELYFNIQHAEPSAKQKTGEALPNSEVRRRNNINRIRAFLRLNINGRFVTRSRDAKLSWPNLEIEIMEQFQVCLFTMPSSISIEIVIGGIIKDTVVDVLDLEIPGSHVKALTSAAVSIKEMLFSKRRHDYAKFGTLALGVPKYTASMTQEQKDIERKRAEKEEELANAQDIKGVIYVKSEWKGDGPDMPPMKSENVFRQAQPQKVRKNYTDEEQSRLLLKQLYIDVNDPRNERIIKLLKETKNEFLLKLLRDDAKNPVATLKPFRHMLLEARAKDPDLSKTPIPLLESEVIQDSMLLDKLEVLFREQAYKEYLEKKIEEERKGMKTETEQKVYNLDLEDNAIKFDSECIRRRQMFFDKLKHFQREVKSGGHQKAATQYKSIVREFELLESENPLLALFNKLFITGRKLKPVVQKRQAVSLEAVKDAKILIHIIKGFNVPIRNSAKQDILSKFHGGGGRGPGMMGMGPQNPYGNSRAGPFATTLNQLGGNAGYGGMSGPQGFDPRQSFMGGAPGMGGYGNNGYQNDRMMGVNLNNLNQPGRPQMTVQGDIRNLSEDQLRQLYRTHRVEPVIEVRIVYNEEYSEVKITNVAEGDFPEWNEILEFPFSALNKRRFTRLELINTKSMIYVTLYDREQTAVGTGRVEIEQNFRYLGSFSIPLISLLNNPPKIDAIFKVERPLALFNYQVETNSFFFLNQQDVPQLPGVEGQQLSKPDVPNTYLSMSISLDPILELPQENELEYYIGLEKQNLLAAASEWVKTLKKGKFEKRNIKAFGENVNGQSVMISRYVQPQNPPLDIYDPKKKDPYGIEKAARYVSLIPMIEDNQSFNDALPDLWCTSQEFLDLGAGDVEEHALLLCNYFNFIDANEARPEYESYVALGIGYPEGKTAYVLRRDKLTNHVELWNPMKGEAYYFGREEQKSTILCMSISTGYSLGRRMNDAICQLKSVGCIIGKDNVWANVQEFDDPALISFDLDKAKLWRPFLTSANRNKYFTNGHIASEQSPVLNYMRPMEKERADVIAMKIQNYITEQFEAQRIADNRMRTKWNNQMENVLNSILAKCELRRKKSRQGAVNSDLRVKGQVDDDIQQTISDIQTKINTNAKGMKSWGFPINATFVSLPMLWEEVKNTKIHLVYDDDAEFSLYVYVEPYSHNVLSVWFYLLALTKDRRRNNAGGGDY